MMLSIPLNARGATVPAMCEGCKRETSIRAWVNFIGFQTRKVCEAYEHPTKLMSARQGTPCLAYSDGKEKT